MRKPRIILRETLQKEVIAAIGRIFCQANEDVITALANAREIESDPMAQDMLQTMLDNAEISCREQIPTCQDTGTVLVFAELGTAVLLSEGTWQDAIDETLSIAWDKYYLRQSIVRDPLFDRTNCGNQFPCELHIKVVDGEKATFHIGLKGGGAENMSRLKMFNPTAPRTEIEDFIVDTVVSAGGRPCPPVIVGVGIGGNFESCAMLAKRALFLPLGHGNENADYREMEHGILERINSEGQGIMGMAGKTTALAVHILTAKCHIASLPVAVNLDCHAHRCTEFTL